MNTDPEAPRRRPGRPRHETPSPEYIKRREEIVDVAVDVFKDRGYDAGSLDDVAEALGLRKASLYYYVRSKAHLLYLVFDRAISGALEQMETIAASSAAEDRLGQLLRHQIQTVAADPNLFTVFFDQRPRLDTDYEDAIRVKERRYVHIFVDAVKVAIDSGTMPPIDPRYGAQLLLGMANWTYKWFDDATDDVGGLTDAAFELVLKSRRST